MYSFGHCKLRKINNTAILSFKQGMEPGYQHWINPLFYKCDELFYPDSNSW